ETPFGIQNVPRRPVWVAMRDAPFDDEAVARLLRYEQLREIVRDNAHGETVHLRNIVAKCLRRSCPCIRSESCHHCGDETRSAHAQRSGSRCEWRSAVA